MSRTPNLILMLGLNYPPERTGIAPYTGGLAVGLADRGRRVRVVTSHPHYPAWKITPGYGGWSREENLRGVSVRRVLHFVPSMPTAIRRALSEVTFGARQALTRWRRPDAIVVVSPALLSSALCRLYALIAHRRTPFVVWVQDLYGVGLSETGQAGGPGARAIRLIEGWLLRSSSMVVVIHDRFVDRICQDVGVHRDQVAVVRNWTHLAPMLPVDVGEVRARYGWAEDETIVLHTGNMGVKQGLHHVIDAGRLAEQRGMRVRFILVGNGSQREALLEQVAKAPTTTELLLPLEDAEFSAVVRAADVLLVNELPGVAEMAVPSKLTSYFAAGRPVLAATDSAGITAQEVRSANAGLVVAAGDSAALLDGVSSLIADRGLAERLGQNGRRYMETVLDETIAIERFDSLLTDLIAKAAEKHPE